MAMYKAIKTFSGNIHMKKGEVMEINNTELEADLLNAGLAIAVDAESKANESKPEAKPKAKTKTPKKAVKEDGSNA